MSKNNITEDPTGIGGTRMSTLLKIFANLAYQIIKSFQLGRHLMSLSPIKTKNPLKRSGQVEGSRVHSDPAEPALKTNPAKSKYVGWAQIGLILIVLAVAIYMTRSSDSGPVRPGTFTPPTTAGSSSIPPVNVILPGKDSFNVSVPSTGTITVRNYVDLTPQVSGRVSLINPKLRVGGKFSAGEELLRIEQTDFRLKLSQAEADIASARSSLMLQVAKSDAAKANYALLNPGKSVPSLVALTPQIAQAEAQLAAARSRAAIAALDLERTNFALPFEGIVTESSAEVGQLLSANRSFGQVFATDSIELVIPLSPADFMALDNPVGREVALKKGEYTATAIINRVSAELDERSRFAMAYANIPYTDKLPPGSFVDIDITGPRLTEAYLLPESVMQAEQAVWFVEDGKLSRHYPRIYGENAEGLIVEPFEFGEGIVNGTVPGAMETMSVIAIVN